MLLSRAEFGVHQDPRSFSAKLLSSQHELVPGTVPPQGQDFAPLLVELHEVPLRPICQPVRVPLSGHIGLLVNFFALLFIDLFFRMKPRLLFCSI